MGPEKSDRVLRLPSPGLSWALDEEKERWHYRLRVVHGQRHGDQCGQVEHLGHEGHSSCSRAEVSIPQDSLINESDWTFLDPILLLKQKHWVFSIRKDNL